MNYDLISSFGRTCPDYVHPVLADAADAIVETAGTSPEQTSPSVSFAEVSDFVAGFYASIEEPTFSRSFPRLGSSGLMAHGRFLTLNISVLHSADSAYSVCSLAEILESSAPLKYYLFATACNGILRRAKQRGRSLPPMLKWELDRVSRHFPANLKAAIKAGWDPALPPPFVQVPAHDNQDGGEMMI